jgi:hypothetical protein
MKITILITLLLFFGTLSYGQVKIERYCEIKCSEKAFSKYLLLKISFGQDDHLVEDSAYIRNMTAELLARKFKDKVDILNYMSDHSWNLISSYGMGLISPSTLPDFFFYFKKIY